MLLIEQGKTANLFQSFAFNHELSHQIIKDVRCQKIIGFDSKLSYFIYFQQETGILYQRLRFNIDCSFN